jgi:4-amino-4-deoxy-L-arabinose transferase-like glycosyltransferase
MLRDHRLALACGVFKFLFVWWLWGSLRAPAINHDEVAYILQARIFASGRLVAPSPPHPEFFQQWHVLVRPVLASKYPPGQSLLLVPGVWLGLPGLVPALCGAVGASLLFVLARELISTEVGLLAVALSSTSPMALRFSASYFSEISVSALFLCAWFALYRHWRTGKQRWLIVLAIAVAWGGITRPLTMLAFSIPCAVAVLFSIRHNRSWRDVPIALAMSLAILAIFPVWNYRVTGNWRLSPYAEYARQYMPADRMGFGVTSLAPADSSSEAVLAFDRAVRSAHRSHVLGNLGEIAVARAGAILQATWAIGPMAVLLLVPAALVLPVGVTRILISTVLLVFLAYLLYAHQPDWTLYYLELQAPLAFLPAAGIHGLTRRLDERFTWPGNAR